MDPIWKQQESGDKMYQFISQKKQALGKAVVDPIMDYVAFSEKNLEMADLADKLNTEQMLKMLTYQKKQDEYVKQLQKLEKKKNTVKGMIKYLEIKIQAEQNAMIIRLVKAHVLGKWTAKKRIKAECLRDIDAYRRILLGYYKDTARSKKEIARKDQLEAEIVRDGKAVTEAAAEFDIRVLTTAALDQIRAERQAAESAGADPQALMQEFLDADYSKHALEAGYVIQNLNTCLHNVELIRRMRRMVFTGDKAAKVTQKMEAVSEYANVVESVLWEYGLRIDQDTLQIREIYENDEAFAKRRQAYQANGALRYYLAVKKYQKIQESEEAPPAEQQVLQKTRMEENLSAMEARLKIAAAREKVSTRGAIQRERAETGDIIKASEEEAQGKREHIQLKVRLLTIFNTYKHKLLMKKQAGGKAFQALQVLIEDYVYANRDIYENRTRAEEKEASALKALKIALFKIKTGLLDRSSRYAAILLGMLTEANNGYLEAPPGEIHVVEDKNIVVQDQKVNGKNYECTYKDCTDIPLFTHRPNIKDIAQGGLGDCYLLAGLISVVNQNPEEIMNIMKDNGNGTVTVRLHREETDASGNTVYKPCYTTVRKTVPIIKSFGIDAFTRGALWVKMMEKAYVASGLHIIDRINANRKKKGLPEMTYGDLKTEIDEGRKSLDYDNIRGGRAGKFISLLLGKKNEENALDKHRAEHLGERISKLLPAKTEPQWSASPERKFGHEGGDSIVYEYISRQNAGLAQDFLNLEKPAPEASKDSYEAKKKELQQYRRSCILHLDIVDALTKELKKDFLKLDDEGEVQNWYQKLKDMFLQYKTRKATAPLSKADEIINDVWNNYLSKDFKDSFANIQINEFNITIDILQERHLELLRRKQSGGAGTGAGVPAQSHRYSKRDLKLYHRIEEALRSGAYVAFGTRKFSDDRTGKNGESEAGGMVGTHAYTIINTRRIMVNHEERFFVVVMNPWAEKGVVYKVEADGIKEHAVQGKKDNEKEEGVFCLELSRFAEVVRRWDKVAA